MLSSACHLSYTKLQGFSPLLWVLCCLHDNWTWRFPHMTIGRGSNPLAFWGPAMLHDMRDCQGSHRLGQRAAVASLEGNTIGSTHLTISSYRCLSLQIWWLYLPLSLSFLILHYLQKSFVIPSSRSFHSRDRPFCMVPFDAFNERLSTSSIPSGYRQDCQLSFAQHSFLLAISSKGHMHLKKKKIGSRALLGNIILPYDWTY